MSYAPCKNPSCKSYGKPHPNCRCYAEMAHGGTVNFCDSDRAHQSDCAYFANGGSVISSIPGENHNTNPEHAVAGHISNSGLTGILRMNEHPDIAKYDSSVKRGHKSMHDTVHRVFEKEAHKKEDRSKHHKYINDWIDKGGITNDIQQEVYNQNGAQEPHGGVLKKHPIEQAYPEQNIMLQSAKARASNYLSGLKPQSNAPKLAFDESPDTKEQQKKYDAALAIADHPLSILHDLSKGTVTPEQVQHLNAIYPELNDALKKKITEKVIEFQMGGKKPDSKVRQGLSLLMGVPLSGELQPQNIMAAQAVFAANKGPQQPQPTKPSKSGSSKSLTNSDKSYLTSQQSLVARQQKKT